ncbi:conserved hypothetical protein [Bradyrhizobium sp. STM 3843]|uniref:BadF/BadG/BcrA/BcrD ATPase family protein n=1 Tax=Bradyrhizobium sp. STM 3843 TaxID=551947 RepID=UPI0002403821|nr:BadF/BadG/BcrA/BcrD ATPase family protein [Bradyrhizobium sp. STM 3843]CCE09656.1 conserved hypothetical protein [Bradyrhizobium sp. STM 3843]
MGANGTTYLSIDGGGTRRRARIEDENGRVLGEASSGPARTRIGLEKARRSIMEITQAAAAQSGQAREDVTRTHAGIGLAGLRRRGAEAAFNEVSYPFASVAFISHGLAACLGAHSGADGAIVVAGAGSVSVGLIDGCEIRVAGYGFTVSDECSGADLGLQVVRLALRTADRRGELISLLSEALGAFDHDPEQAVAWSDEARATDYAVFAPIVMRDANQGDPVGGRFVERAADAIGDLLDLFLARGFDRLSALGGFADDITPWLTPDLRARLRHPDAGALRVARGRFDLPKPGSSKLDRPKRETDHDQDSKFRV